MYLDAADLLTPPLPPPSVPDRRSFDDSADDIVSSAERSDRHPYGRHVNRPLSGLLSALRLDKRFVRGRGCDLYDEQGRRYLDAIAAYGALPFGFNPPEIWAALRDVELRDEPSLVQPSLLDAAGELAERLVALAPGELRHVTFTNSGAEAVEAAIKLCRAATGRLGIVSTDNSFHGKTLAALSATGNPKYQEGFCVPGEPFAKVPFGDADALRRLLAERPEEFAAFLVEPIQGEGGIVEPPPGYLAAVRDICHQAGVLLVFDEIQTGLGRTGTLFGCDQEQVAPDVMTLAKALGGGLMPIGAVLHTEALHTEAFALKHSSTFAGNTLACRAGLAALALITRDDNRLVRQVRRNGTRLKNELVRLQAKYPHLIAEVRGRGYMLGLHFHVDRALWPDSLLGVAAEQDFFTPLFASYLLNVEGVRVAPTLNGNAVVRIEPALNCRWAQCEELLSALKRALHAFSDGQTGRIIQSILRGRACPGSAGHIVGHAAVADVASVGHVADQTRFAFLLHPLDVASFVDFDPSLGQLAPHELEEFTGNVSDLIEPFVLSRTRIASATGRTACGEFIALPWTAEQLSRMPSSQAIATVRSALDLAKSRGAQLVGLGAFTSVVTRGGLAVSREGVPVTTGNSYTAVSAAEAIQVALNSLATGLDGDTSAAVIGSTGAIGRAMTLLLAADVGRLILIGNPERAAGSVRRRLLKVACDACRHVAALHRKGRRFRPETLGDRLLEASEGDLSPDASDETCLRWVERLERGGLLVLTQNLREALPDADVVVAATSTTAALVGPHDLKPGAVVCDLSRPANISPEVGRARPDVLVIDGGVIAVPGQPHLGRFGLDRGLAYACMAETMMLALDGRLRHMSLGVDLSADNLRLMQGLAERHGFRVARLRSGGRMLADADWNRLLAAREQVLAASHRRTA